MIVFRIFLLLMMAGNSFWFYRLLTGGDELMHEFPRVEAHHMKVLLLLPLLNLAGLAGMWFFRSWGPWVALFGASWTILADLYFAIHYHLYLALPALFLLLFFWFACRHRFK
jgi:hypothetical protein